MVQEKMMIAGEVAAYLRCSPSTVRRMARRGQVPHYRFGKLVRFRLSEIERWLALQQEGAALLRGRAMSAQSRSTLPLPDGRGKWRMKR